MCQTKFLIGTLLFNSISPAALIWITDTVRGMELGTGTEDAEEEGRI